MRVIERVAVVPNSIFDARTPRFQPSIAQDAQPTSASSLFGIWAMQTSQSPIEISLMLAFVRLLCADMLAISTHAKARALLYHRRSSTCNGTQHASTLVQALLPEGFDIHHSSLYRCARQVRPELIESSQGLANCAVRIELSIRFISNASALTLSDSAWVFRRRSCRSTYRPTVQF